MNDAVTNIEQTKSAKQNTADNSDQHNANPSQSAPITAVEVNDITVLYRSYKEQPNTLKEVLLNFVKRGQVNYYSTFAALSKVSFSVKKGEIIGFIGSNGAGKSTLLNVLAGVLPPSSGTVNLTGSVDSLRSLGAGFDSELNAIENIYLYGSLRGRSKAEIKARIPEILAFAELEEFAQTPVKYYSSGMFARLGFACAIDKNPDVLLVDEVLAVGDERFQTKCKQVFQNFLDSQRTIVMVSHNLNFMETICSRIGLLSKGELVFLGNPQEAIKLYRSGGYKTALDGKRL